MYIIYGNKINIKTSFKYFMFGLLPVGIVFFIHNIFPITSIPIDLNSYGYIENKSNAWWLTGIVFYFLQIAFIEELAKTISTRFIHDGTEKKITMFHAMFYSSMMACGFSYIENLIYIASGGQNIVFIRMFMPTMLHAICGSIIGYFMGLHIEDRVRNRLNGLKNSLNWIFRYLTGLVCASILHGTYNYSLDYATRDSSIEIFHNFYIYPISLGILAVCSILVFELYKKAFNSSFS